MEEKQRTKILELRQDLVTGDWVVIATSRAKRPEDFAKQEKEEIKEESGKACLFCDPTASGQEKDTLLYSDAKGDWSLRVFPNKFPAFNREDYPKHFEEGPYFGMDGIGYHEIIVTRDHERQIANMETAEVAEILDAYQDRYIDLMNKKSVNYIEIFHNHGKEAGASIPHPHSQLIAMPILPADVRRSLEGAEKYFGMYGKCAHCEMIGWEKEEKRVIFQNEHFIVFAPFVPRVNFELRIYPKKHQSNFEKITEIERKYLAEALQNALCSLYKGLKNPDYNFFIHTAPCDEKKYNYYHWHIEFLPKTNTWAGLELGTGVEVITIKPEEVAKFLRKFIKK